MVELYLDTHVSQDGTETAKSHGFAKPINNFSDGGRCLAKDKIVVHPEKKDKS